MPIDEAQCNLLEACAPVNTTVILLSGLSTCSSRLGPHLSKSVLCWTWDYELTACWRADHCEEVGPHRVRAERSVAIVNLQHAISDASPQ